MDQLRVERFFRGGFEPVGTLASEGVFSLNFAYDEAYLSRPHAVPLSLSLPLSRRNYEIQETLPFFEGLLPEGRALESIARELRVSPYATFDLLRSLGEEVIGAVRFLDETQELQRDHGYKPLSSEDIEQLSEKSELVVARYLKSSRLSLAGAQHKVGLYIDESEPDDRRLYLPDGTAASTHIVKTANNAYPGIIYNEYFCLTLARACGLAVPDAEIIKTSRPMLAIRRFDRVIDESCILYDGLSSPDRLHQEDFCQALGIERSKKYEAGVNDYPKMISECIRAVSAHPLQDVEALALFMTFCYLIGNCDNHMKNLSIVFSRDYQTLRLAPFYDLACTTMYALDREMGLRIGSTRVIDKVVREDFALLGASLGVGARRMLRLLDDMRERLSEAIESVTIAAFLKEFEQADEIVQEISQGAMGRIQTTGVS